MNFLRDDDDSFTSNNHLQFNPLVLLLSMLEGLFKDHDYFKSPSGDLGAGDLGANDGINFGPTRFFDTCS